MHQRLDLRGDAARRARPSQPPPQPLELGYSPKDAALLPGPLLAASALVGWRPTQDAGDASDAEEDTAAFPPGGFGAALEAGCGAPGLWDAAGHHGGATRLPQLHHRGRYGANGASGAAAAAAAAALQAPAAAAGTTAIFAAAGAHTWQAAWPPDHQAYHGAAQHGPASSPAEHDFYSELLGTGSATGTQIEFPAQTSPPLATCLLDEHGFYGPSGGGAGGAYAGSEAPAPAAARQGGGVLAAAPMGLPANPCARRMAADTVAAPPARSTQLGGPAHGAAAGCVGLAAGGAVRLASPYTWQAQQQAAAAAAAAALPAVDTAQVGLPPPPPPLQQQQASGSVGQAARAAGFGRNELDNAPGDSQSVAPHEYWRPW